MSGRLRVKDWEKFQHYKDRSPPWIKLSDDLLDDYDFSYLPDHVKGQLMSIWLLASKHDGAIPNDPDWVATRICASEPVNLEVLVNLGFLVPALPEEDTSHRADWPSRYIPDDVRKAVYERDNHQCLKCGKKSDLEVDHILPTRWGGTGEIGNLQILCTSCNRKKRWALDKAQQNARQDLYDEWDLRSANKEEGDREQTEGKTNGRPWPARPKKKNGQYLYPALFESIWKAYPDRYGSNPKVGAYRAVRARIKSGEEPTDLLKAARHYHAHCREREIVGTEYVSMASTFYGTNEPFRDFIEPPSENGRKRSGALDRPML